MQTIRDVIHDHRAALLAAVGTVAYLTLAAWGALNVIEGDWFIGSLFLGCALVGLVALGSTVRRMRREERRS